MALNTIELPEFVIAELYRNSLLASDEPSTPITQPVSQPKLQPTPASIPGNTLPTAKQTPDPIREAAPQPKTASAQTPSATAGLGANPSYKFLGNNGKKVTLLVASPGVAYLPDDQLAFLAKMLEACKMNMGDVALVNHATTPVTIANIKNQLLPAILVSFGVPPAAIGLPTNFPLFEIHAYEGCNYLQTPSLEELVRPTEEGKLLKSKLWICLKTLFNI